MTAQEAIAFIESVSWKGSVPGLERPQGLLDLMGNPEKQLKYIHIGGTNGKGSTAAMTASILQKAGYKTGLYTSPHIYRFHERIRVNGVDISDEDLAQITEYVKPLAGFLSRQEYFTIYATRLQHIFITRARGFASEVFPLPALV